MEKRAPVHVLSILITPNIVGDQTLARGLDQLKSEDPTIRVVRSDSYTGRMQIAGVSELHLEIIIDRLAREFKVEAAVGRPEVFLKTVLSTSTVGESKYLKATRNRRQYAHVTLQVSPRDDGSGYLFENRLLGRALPEQYIPAIEQGIQVARMIGPCGGHPVEDVTVELVDGTYHDVDSSAAAFRIAASQAFFDAATKARPVVVEPVMRVEVIGPLQCLDEVNRILLHRGARILARHQKQDSHSIAALLRVAHTFGFSHEFRETTKGKGIYSMRFERYEPVPPESNLDDLDRDSLVGAPRKPLTPDRTSAIALPEPDDEDPDDDAWLQPRG